MQLHELKPKNKIKKSKRVGRGGKRGTYSGRGMKGQKSRSGARFQPIIRYLIKRYPKLKGYRENLRNKDRISKIAIINLDILEQKFNSGDKVSPEILFEKKIIRKSKGKSMEIKILSKGKLTKGLNIENCLFSKQAKEKIEKAKGTIK